MTVPTNNEEADGGYLLNCVYGPAYRKEVDRRRGDEDMSRRDRTLLATEAGLVAVYEFAARRPSVSGDNVLPYLTISEAPAGYSPEAMHAYALGYNTALEAVSASQPREVRGGSDV